MAAFLVAFVLHSCSSGGPDPVAVTPPVIPVIQSLSATTLSVGQRLTIVGTGFSTDVNTNRVVFNNNLASVKPATASTDTLTVVVPENANSGPMVVTSLGQHSNAITVEITRAMGDVWVMGEGAGYEFKLPAPGGSEEYLLIPYSAATAVANYAYWVTPSAATVYPSPSAGRPTAGAATRAPDMAGRSPAMTIGPSEIRSMPLEFETRVRQQGLDYIARHAHETRPIRLVRRRASAPRPVATFSVLACPECDTSNPANYVSVTADLKYSGTNALIYADINQPTGSFTQADYDAFGMQFDATIFPTDTSYFASPSDIDGNGKVIMLFTPRVNELTADGQAGNTGFISGFFLLNDLAPNFFPATSNASEIFYSVVPDPNNEYGNVLSKSLISAIVPGTLAHEFEHMISFGYRFVFLGGGTGLGKIQETWLEEGMAHIAEDVNALDEGNIPRVIRYLADPGISLFGSDTLEQRGGIFLFLRYLGDRFGDAIYEDIVKSSCLGRACIESATGKPFFDLVGDYCAMLYLSGRGITSNPRYELASFDMQSDFVPLPVTGKSAVGGAFSGFVQAAGADFYRVNGLSAPATLFKVTSSSNARMRVGIVRVQ